MMLWGIDDYAGKIVNYFVKAFEQRFSASEFLKVFEPEKFDDPFQEFQAEVVNLREIGKAHSVEAEPQVVIFSAAFVTTPAEKRSLLKTVSQILGTTLPGSQSLILISLLPHLTSEPQEKIETFKCFLRLEKIAWEVSFLSIIFVNQLSQSILNQTDVGDIAKDPVFELLYRELMDSDLEKFIRGIGDKAIGNRNEVSGRKSCYSTLGTCKLIFHPRECLEYLTTKFQRQFFFHVLNDETTFDEKQLESIQNRADEFIFSQVETQKRKSYESQKIPSGSMAQLPDHDTLRKITVSLERDFNSTADRLEARIRKDQNSVRDEIDQELQKFLAESPGYLGAANLYTSALKGQKIVRSDAETTESPCGLRLFESLVCVAWPTKILGDFVRSRITKLNLPVDLNREEDLNAPQRLREVIKKVASPSDNFPAQNACALDVLTQSTATICNHLENAPGNPEAARILVKSLIAHYAKISESLVQKAKDLREERKRVSEEIQSLKQAYGFIAKSLTKRREYKDKLENMMDRIKELDDEQMLCGQAYSNMGECFLQMLNRVVLPCITAAVVCHFFTEAVSEAVKKYDDFVSGIERPIGQKWNRVSQLSDRVKPTLHKVLSQEILDIIYKEFVTDRKLSDLAGQVFKFFPLDLPEEELKKLAYYNCHNLSDYFHDGPDSITSRIADFATDLFKSVQDKNILDIMECMGRDGSYNYLKHVIEKTKKILDFSPGLLPLVEQSGNMNTVLVVKTDQEIKSRLKTDYSYLFEPGTQFIDNNDANLIDFTSLIFGFPAFVIHGLSECRELFFKQAPNDPADLWPVSDDT
jgi:hypothetical protein